MKKVLLMLIWTIGNVHLQAQERALGYWEMVNEKTGRWKNVIELYQKGDKYFGKIVATNPKPGTDPNPICKDCKGDRKGQHILGMDVLTDLKYNKKTDEFVGGEILDPQNGNEYSCKVWLGEDGNLRVRGYKFVFHKTYMLLPSNKEF